MPLFKLKGSTHYRRLLADGSIWNVSMTRCYQKAQRPERLFHTQRVAGSTPAASSNQEV